MSSSDRQRIERVAGVRRARLTPVDGTDATPEAASKDEDPDAAPGPVGRDAASGSPGPNDDRLRQDVPPHY